MSNITENETIVHCLFSEVITTKIVDVLGKSEDSLGMLQQLRMIPALS